MRIIVTGASGFLGRAVVGSLLERGDEVVGYDRVPQWLTPRSGRFDMVVGDLTSASLDLSPFRRCDAVIHLAGAPGVRSVDRDARMRRRRDNVLATQRVLKSVPRSVPVVVTSSSSVYGGCVQPGQPLVETDALRPLGDYARSKVAVENLCHRRARAGGRVVIARPFTLVGARQRADMMMHIWLRRLIDGDPIPVLGSLRRSRDFTDVNQAAAVLTALLEVDEPRIVNVGTGRAVTLERVLAACVARVGVSPEIRLLPASQVEPPHTLADTRTLRSLVGFVPTTNIEAVVNSIVVELTAADAGMRT